MTGLTQNARDLLDLLRTVDSAVAGPPRIIRRDEIEALLGAHSNDADTGRALHELDEIGDLEDVTRAGDDGEPISFRLA